LLNDDTEVEPGWADAAMAHFADPTIAAVAPLVLWGPPDRSRVDFPPRIDSAGDRYYLGGIAGKCRHGQLLAEDSSHSRSVFGASASSAFYRRDVVLRTGAFPESFGAYFEDVDLAFRLHRRGYRVIHEPASRVWHCVSASHGRSNWRLLAQQSRNEERVFWRNLPLRAVPLHLLVLAAKAWRRFRQGGLLPFLWGRLSVLGEWLDLLCHRRHWQRVGVCHDPAAWGVESSFWG
jgi:GT2 family glycosyltransferase